MFRPLVFFDRHRPGAAVSETALIAARTARLPRIVWIELTSRCPYDCPFCSRKTLRGHGVNMPFTLYRRIVGELGKPEVLRLNYSGESTHHPNIVEAVEIASATGAWVELVSVPAALAADRLAAIVSAGLNRLTISLHTLDPAQFAALYGFAATLDTMLANLRLAASFVGRTQQPFMVDLAFVATAANLQQLPRVAAIAAELALPVLAVHPVIRRTEIPARFADELDESGTLRPDFRADLQRAIASARMVHPALAVEASTPELENVQSHAISTEPVSMPGPLPDGARIHSCDQDPFETLHILADGKVVTCEVRDQFIVGDLATTTVEAVWHGQAMRAFREAFILGHDPHCHGCVYKRVHRPTPLATRVAASENVAQLLQGWYPPENGVVWGKPEAALLLARKRGATTLLLSGVLPPGSDRTANTLTVQIDGNAALTVTNDEAVLLPFTRRARLPDGTRGRDAVAVNMSSKCPWRPIVSGGVDTRTLGFALTAAEII